MKSLHPEDLTVGLFVTVLRAPQMPTIVQRYGMAALAREECRQWHSVVMRIVAIDLPYVVVDILRPNSRSCTAQVQFLAEPEQSEKPLRLSFDTRQRWIFGTISDDFVRAFGIAADGVPNATPRPPDPPTPPPAPPAPPAPPVPAAPTATSDASGSGALRVGVSPPAAGRSAAP